MKLKIQYLTYLIYSLFNRIKTYDIFYSFFIEDNNIKYHKITLINTSKRKVEKEALTYLKKIYKKSFYEIEFIKEI